MTLQIESLYEVWIATPTVRVISVQHLKDILPAHFRHFISPIQKKFAIAITNSKGNLLELMAYWRLFESCKSMVMANFANDPSFQAVLKENSAGEIEKSQKTAVTHISRPVPESPKKIIIVLITIRRLRFATSSTINK